MLKVLTLETNKYCFFQSKGNALPLPSLILDEEKEDRIRSSALIYTINFSKLRIHNLHEVH